MSNDTSEQKTGWWKIINSPIILLLISAVVIAGGAKLYSDRQEAFLDQRERRASLSDLLVEYRLRLSALEELDSQLGIKFNMYADPESIQKMKLSERERVVFEKKSARIGKLQKDVLTGTGTYTAGAPQFANVNLHFIASQIELTAGVPNVQAGAIQLLGFFEAPPEVLWVFVHAYLPMMREFYVNRHMMLTNGQLPLLKGAQLSKRQQVMLGMPDVKPGELEKLREQVDRKHAKIQETLRGAED